MNRTDIEKNLSGFLPELARLECSILKIKAQEIAVPDHLNEMILNPSLQLLNLCWKKLTDHLSASGSVVPEPGNEFVMIWKHPGDGSGPRRGGIRGGPSGA